jgi:prepilin-type N-terminal cleavage/methylation domain-containing protein
MKKTDYKGFSLIELMVVISIIGILSIIAITALNSARDRSRASAALSTASGIVPAISGCVESATTVGEGMQKPTVGGQICGQTKIEDALWPELPKRYSYGTNYSNGGSGSGGNPDDWNFTITSDADEGKERVACDQSGCKDCRESITGPCENYGSKWETQDS